MYINKEFMKRFNGSTTKETTKEINDIKDKILFIMKSNPSITAEQIATEIKEITVDGVWYHIRQLKDRGIITREGSTKKGKWIVKK